MRYTRIRRGSAFQERDFDGRFRDQGRNNSPVGYGDNSYERYREQDRNGLRDWREKRSEDYGDDDDFGTTRGNRGSRSQNYYSDREIGNQNYRDNARFNSGDDNRWRDDRHERSYDSDDDDYDREYHRSAYNDRDIWNRDRWNSGNSGYGSSSVKRDDFRDFENRRQGYWRGRRSDLDHREFKGNRREFPSMPQENVERISNVSGRTSPGGGRTNSQRERNVGGYSNGRRSGVGSSTGPSFSRRSRGR